MVILQEFVLQNNSLIIIGANGSGKSKLGAWIEIHHSEQVHRICAQRSLVFGDYIVQKSYEQSTNLLMCRAQNNILMALFSTKFKSYSPIGWFAFYMKGILE